ncbi:MAG: retroviral-like aspartic protease family protein [Ignavibacteria bacterium]|nr:retroviral-like aspartic protease family protein [Ignavibacteria bacterium]
MFKKKVKVSNPYNTLKFFEAEFWVDTGALYSLIPQNLLEGIGFEPEGTKNILLADGRTERKLFGYCKFEIEELTDKAICPVIAGSNDSILLLGATALENFAVEVDPVSKTLHPILAIIAGFH